MAKLKDLLPNSAAEKHHIKIQGVEIPVSFNMGTMEYVAEAYGKSFVAFERDMKKVMSKSKVNMDTDVLKIMSSLIYGIVRSGGTETTPQELINSIPFDEIESVYNDAMKVFNSSYFQPADGKKVKN